MPEYGYKALQVLLVDGVRAHNPGDWVPAQNLEAHGWEEGEHVEKCPLPAPDTEADAATPPALAQPPEAPTDPAPPTEPAKPKTARRPADADS